MPLDKKKHSPASASAPKMLYFWTKIDIFPDTETATLENTCVFFF